MLLQLVISLSATSSLDHAALQIQYQYDHQLLGRGEGCLARLGWWGSAPSPVSSAACRRTDSAEGETRACGCPLFFEPAY